MEPQEFDQFQSWKPTYPDSMLGKGLLYREGKAILYGRYKSFKSMLSLWLMLCVADGVPWLGFETPSGGRSVLYVQSEVPHSLLHQRFFKMWAGWKAVNGNKRPLNLVHFGTEPYLKLDTTAGHDVLDNALTELEPSLVIMDPVYKLMSGNILDPNSVRNLLDSLDGLIAKHKFALMLIAHPRKSAIDEAEWGSDALLGSVFFSAWADSVIKVTRQVTKEGKLTNYLKLNFDVVRYAQEILEEKEVLLEEDSLQFNLTSDAIRL